MKLIIFIVSVMHLMSCSSAKKCPDVDGFNPVMERSTCRVRIRNTFYADQLSPGIKDKIKQGQQVEFVWVPTVEKGPSIVPAHFEVKMVVGEGL